MPRGPRIKGENCIYHIIQRGNERKNIFISDEDKLKFIEILIRKKQKYNFNIYAYCLMSNHTHLAIGCNNEDISELFQSINVSYAIYFNRKYRRCGHLFQDRFKSEIVKDDTYLLYLTKYIHNNPVKAKIVEKPEHYPWSSYKYYFGEFEDKGLVEVKFVLDLVSGAIKKAKEKYKEFVNNGTSEEEFMDFDDGPAVFQDTLKITADDLNNDYLKEVKKMIAKCKRKSSDKRVRNKLIKEIRNRYNLTLKEIGELFGGLSESQVSRIMYR